MEEKEVFKKDKKVEEKVIFQILITAPQSDIQYKGAKL